jgi:hypothetical protein
MLLSPAIRVYVHMVTSVQVAHPLPKCVPLGSLRVVSVPVLRATALHVNRVFIVLIRQQVFNVPQVLTALYNQRTKV